MTRDADMLRSTELEAHIPASILSCRAVAREIVFTSRCEITEFHLRQRIFLDAHCIEGNASLSKPSGAFQMNRF